jgi:hypothetical protein
MISGNNFQFGQPLNDDSYYFSNISHIWGWASWRDRWQHDYDVSMIQWPKIRDGGRVADWVKTKSEQYFLSENFEKVFKGKIDTWDYQWSFGARLNGRISVMPNVNLISNIGFGIDATHTKRGNELAGMLVEEMNFPLKHPFEFFASTTLDHAFHKRFNQKSIIHRIGSKIKNILSRWGS